MTIPYVRAPSSEQVKLEWSASDDTEHRVRIAIQFKNMFDNPVAFHHTAVFSRAGGL